MFKFAKGFRTYVSLLIVAILGGLVAAQGHCTTEVNTVCDVVNQPWFGQAIVVMSAVAAWFRKLSGTSK